MPVFEITGPDGRKFRVTGPNQEGALAALQAQMAGTAPQAGGINPDTDGPMEGFGAAFRSGIDAPLENIGETLEVLGATDAGANLRGLTDAPEGYASASERFINDPAGEDEGFGWRYLPKAVVEQAGQLGGSLVTRAGGAVIGGAAGSVIPGAGTAGGAAVGAFAGPALFESIQVLGPVANTRARNDGRDRPNLEDFIYASGTAAGMGALNAIGVRAGSGFTSALREGGTEALQSVTEQTGSTVNTEAGLSVDPRQAVGEGIIGGASMGTVGAARGVVNRATPAPREDTPEARAEATFAQRIQRTAERGDLNGTPFNLKDINTASQNGVRALIDATHKNLVGEMASEAKVLKDLLKPNDTDLFDAAFGKVQAQVGLEMARNKTKSVVTKDNFDALEAIVGDTSEGQNLLNLVRESQVLTKIHNDGYKGGVSQYTDAALPFDGAQNTYNSAAQIARTTLGPMGAVYAGVATGGTSIPLQAGVGLGGRGIDAITGRRSRLNRFVKQNVNRPGIETPSGLPSIVQGRIDQAAAAQRAEEAKAETTAAGTEARKQTNRRLAQAGAPPTEGSPQDIVQVATGLDRSGVAQILRTIERTKTDPVILNAIEAYRGSVDVGGRVPDMSPLIREIKQMAKEMGVRKPDTGTAQAGPSSSTQTASENYQRGIDDNKSMLQDLKDKAKTDATMSKVDKAKVLEALDQLGMNLGSDPGAKVNEIMGTLEGVEPDAVAQYVEPYVTRVMGQQNAAPRNSDGGSARNQLETPNAEPTSQPQIGGILSGGANPSNNPVRSRAPEVPEVKQETALVNASIEIGKPGSEFENGIKDMAGVEKLAAAYDIALKFYNSSGEMRQAVPGAVKGAMGAYQPSTRTANVVSTGDIQELITALHETLHAVGIGSLKTGNFLGEADTVNGLTGQPDKAGIGSLETYMDFIFGKGKSNHLRREVLSEMKHIQDRAQFSTGGVQGPIRGAQSMVMMLKNAKRELEADGQSFEAQKATVRKELKDHQNYERSIGELTVDALLLYAHDPKGMKRVAPNTAKVMRELFRAAGNKKIQFYSHPLAMAVSVVMAIMSKASMEDEEEQQLPPGMLSPQPGMLTA